MNAQKVLACMLVVCGLCCPSLIPLACADGRPALANAIAGDSNNPAEVQNEQIHLLENRVAALEVQANALQGQVAELQQAKNASDAQLAAQPQIDQLRDQVAALLQWKAEQDKKNAAMAALANMSCGMVQAGQPMPPGCASELGNLIQALCKDTPPGQAPPANCK